MEAAVLASRASVSPRCSRLKILVISLSGVGDTLIATPFLHELRANLPDAKIDCFVLWKASADLLEGNPHVDRIIQKNLIKEGSFKALRFVLGLRKERYDASINVHTQGRIHYRIVARLIGATRRYSHSYENHGFTDRLLVQHQIPQDYSVHSIENNNRLLPLLGLKPKLTTHGYEIFLSEAEKVWAENYVSEHRLNGSQVLGVHVGSGGTKNLALKRWPLERFIAFFRQLTAKLPGLKLLLFGGPEEREAHRQVAEQLPTSNILFPETPNLRQAAALIAKCSAFLSVDTALMHLAAAVNVPKQIVIEATTLNPTNVPPRADTIVVRNPAIAGRNLDYYRYDGGPIRGTDDEIRRLMESVTVEAVETAVLSALQG
jgi:heptosyltransferase-2